MTSHGRLHKDAGDRAIVGASRSCAVRRVVVLEGCNADRPEGKRRAARRCLDAGISVIAVPALRHPDFELDHIGLGHDLSPSIVAAQEVVRKLVATMGEAMNRASIVYVDDSFAGGVEPDDDGSSAIPHASSRTSPTTSTCSSSVHALGAVDSAACSAPACRLTFSGEIGVALAG